MPVNWYDKYDRLMERANHPKTPPAEATACREKARIIKDKHLQREPRRVSEDDFISAFFNATSASTNDTTVTGHDGNVYYGSQAYEAAMDALRVRRQEQARRVAEDLLNNQWMWNTAYYDRDGNPRRNEADTDDDYVEKTYAYEEEDAFYDTLQEDDPL